MRISIEDGCFSTGQGALSVVYWPHMFENITQPWGKTAPSLWIGVQMCPARRASIDAISNYSLIAVTDKGIMDSHYESGAA